MSRQLAEAAADLQVLTVFLGPSRLRRAAGVPWRRVTGNRRLDTPLIRLGTRRGTMSGSGPVRRNGRPADTGGGPPRYPESRGDRFGRPVRWADWRGLLVGG